MAIAGIDIGTTGCKCTVYSTDGRQLNEAYIEYEGVSSEGRELDPAVVWEDVRKVLYTASRDTEPLEAIGVTSFGEAFAMLDENDRPLSNSILYTDTRAEEMCSLLTGKTGREKIMDIAGVNPTSNFSISNIMWLKHYRPERYKKAKKVLLYASYVVYMLTGEEVIDYSLACRTMAFDRNRLEWSREILDAAEIDLSLMPKPVPSGALVGTIRKELAAELGLPENVRVNAGCHDQIAAAVGTGSFTTDTAVNGAGTVECITPIFTEPENPRIMMEGNYCIVPYVIPGTYVTYAYQNTGGALLKWYRDQLAAAEARIIKESGRSVYDVFNSSMGEGISDLLILPYFAGAATPYMDNSATGAILGLTLETRSLDIYKALMEGVAFEDLINVQNIAKAGISVNRLISCGGGARSSYWTQLKADVLNIPIESLGSVQAGTMGSVMMAGAACGIYGSLEEAAEVFVKPGRLYEPDSSRNALYMEKFRKYERLYKAVQSVMAD